MKKIIVTVLAGCTALGSVFSQDLEDRKVQAGLVFTGGILFTNLNTSIIESQGLGGTYGLGMNFNYAFNRNIGFSSGIEFSFESFRYAVSGNSQLFYDYNDKEILRQKDNDSEADGTMRLLERKQSPIALTIPTMLIFRTNLIGYFRYFGKFGLRNSFILNQTVTDKGDIYTGGILPDQTNVELSKMKASSDMFIFRSSVGVAAGAEWNFVGHTSLAFEGGFFYGFTPLFSGNGKLDRNSSSLYELENGLNKKYRSFKGHQMTLEFKLSLLF
jgi:hypothetical protein